MAKMTGAGTSRIVAHRGSSLRHRENTMAAFTGAEEEGADGLEFDVRRSSDGHLVIHHDLDLPDGRLISRASSNQLPSEIPSLAEVMERYRSMWLNVEIKNDVTEADYDTSGDLARQVVDEVRGLVDMDQDRSEASSRGGVVISSFDESTLASALGALTDDAARPAGFGFGFLMWLDPALSTSQDLDRFLNDAVAKAVQLGCTALHPHDPLVDQKLVERANAAGLDVNVWTVDDPARIDELARMGVDGIITNDPTGGLSALGRG